MERIPQSTDCYIECTKSTNFCMICSVITLSIRITVVLLPLHIEWAKVQIVPSTASLEPYILLPSTWFFITDLYYIQRKQYELAVHVHVEGCQHWCSCISHSGGINWSDKLKMCLYMCLLKQGDHVGAARSESCPRFPLAALCPWWWRGWNGRNVFCGQVNKLSQQVEIRNICNWLIVMAHSQSVGAGILAGL